MDNKKKHIPCYHYINARHSCKLIFKNSAFIFENMAPAYISFRNVKKNEEKYTK